MSYNVLDRLCARLTDELFQFSEDDLFDYAMGVLSLESKPRVRLFVRRDAFERFVSCVVFVPRDSFSTGLREDAQLPGGVNVPNGGHVPAYTQVNTGIVQDFSVMGVDGLTARFDVTNLFDEKYEIRSGSGVGVFAPQWGPRRGFFVGLQKKF